jgi:hypothetical protein
LNCRREVGRVEGVLLHVLITAQLSVAAIAVIAVAVIMTIAVIAVRVVIAVNVIFTVAALTRATVPVAHGRAVVTLQALVPPAWAGGPTRVIWFMP